MRVVTLFGHLPPLPRGVQAVRESEVALDLPEYDKTVREIPRGGHRLRLPLVIYRLERSAR